MSNKAKSNFVVYISGVAVMVLLSAIVVLLLPIFIINEYLPIEYTRVIIIISLAIAAFAAGLTAGSMTAGREGESVAITVGVYSVLLLFVAICFYDGFTLQLLYELIGSLVGGLAAWLLLVKGRKPRIRRKIRGANR